MANAKLKYEEFKQNIKVNDSKTNMVSCPFWKFK